MNLPRCAIQSYSIFKRNNHQNPLYIFRSFRFKNKRLLEDLMIVDKGGCSYNFPGVGDISYVKDLMTEEIVANDFSCSIFGAYSHPIAKIGWVCVFFFIIFLSCELKSIRSCFQRTSDNLDKNCCTNQKKNLYKTGRPPPPPPYFLYMFI